LQPRVLNIVKTKPDVRDRFFRVAAPVATPRRYSLEAFAPPTRDQGQEGSCGPQSGTEVYYGVRNLYWSQMKYPTHARETLFSANDLYWRVRNRMGAVERDDGVDNRALALSLCKDGMIPEEMRPYNDEEWKVSPTELQNDEARHNRLGSFHFVRSARDLCTVIASGYPAIVGMTLYSSFMSDAVTRSGLVPMPKRGEHDEGGHDMSAWAYDMDMKIGRSVGAVKMLNHWGDAWGCASAASGERGYCWVPFDLIDRAQLDTVTLHFGRPWE